MKSKDRHLLLDVAQASLKMMIAFDVARKGIPDSVEATGDDANADALVDRCISAELELRTALTNAIRAGQIDTDPEHYFGIGRGPLL